MSGALPDALSGAMEIRSPFGDAPQGCLSLGVRICGSRMPGLQVVDQSMAYIRSHGRKEPEGLLAGCCGQGDVAQGGEEQLDRRTASLRIERVERLGQRDAFRGCGKRGQLPNDGARLAGSLIASLTAWQKLHCPAAVNRRRRCILCKIQQMFGGRVGSREVDEQLAQLKGVVGEVGGLGDLANETDHRWHGLR